MYVCMYVCVYVCMCVCMDVCMYVCMCVCIYVCGVCRYVGNPSPPSTHTHTYTKIPCLLTGSGDGTLRLWNTIDTNAQVPMYLCTYAYIPVYTIYVNPYIPHTYILIPHTQTLIIFTGCDKRTQSGSIQGSVFPPRSRYGILQRG
jgi:hypothetical protein